MARGKREPRAVDRVSASSDEEIDEDEAFNSEDERLYGALFEPSLKKSRQSNKDKERDSNDDHDDDSDADGNEVEDLGSDFDLSDDGIASEEDDENGDGGEYMLSLLDNLDKKAENGTNKSSNQTNPTSLLPESEFSSVAIPSSNLTLDQLMNGISDTAKFASVKKTMKGMVRDESSLLDESDPSKLQTPSAPVAKVVSERAQRKVAYQDQVRNVGDWTMAVKQNREAETLDFRPKNVLGRVNTKDAMVSKFEPTTDFEREIAQALEDADAVDEKELIRQQSNKDIFGLDEEGDMFDDDLGANKMTSEEFKKQQGRIAKMKALMFYEEQKRHHMHKIKSKKYRKIRKKQRMKAQETEEQQAAQEDEEFAKELEEKQEMERMKERMSLKHKNTSKWAKRVLRRGKNIDIDTRRALSEQIRVGDDLKKKMLWNNSDDDDGGDDEDLLSQAKRILTETEKDAKETDPEKGLFSLSFMKKGLAKQRERAKEEARELLRELQSAEDFGNDNYNSDDNSAIEASSETSKKVKVKAASVKEMKTLLSDGKLQSSMLDFGNATAVAVSGDIALDISNRKDDAFKQSSEKINEEKELSEISNVGTTITLQTSSSKFQEDKNTRKKSKPNESDRKETIEEDLSNPWLKSPTNNNEKEASSKPADGLKHNSKYATKALEEPASTNIISCEDTSSEKSTSNEYGNQEGTTDKIVSLTQEELARRAFVSPNEAEIEAEFEKEKNSMQERDENVKKDPFENKVVKGWGSWTGEGSLPPKPRKIKSAPLSKVKAAKKRERADDGKKNVIINAKRIKKTANFQIQNVPHPYSSREEYERAMSGAIGAEWNISSAVREMTRPEVITRRGVIIQPISKKVKKRRGTNKF